ncbi:MAG: DUF58 domain-containing protein, partial [Gemmatimonadaceae bacterium]
MTITSPLAHRITAPFRALAGYAPTPRLALLLALAAPVWIFSSGNTGQAAASALVALIALAALADALRIPGARYITLTRDFPATIGVGDSKQATYQISSAWPASLDVTVFQQLPPALSATTLPDRPPLLAAESPLHMTLTVTGAARGAFALGPVAIRIASQWGFVTRSVIYLPGDTISVTPSIAGAGRYRLLAAQQRLRTAGQRVIRHRGAGTSFANLREYVRGDDPRRIDWKATARRQRLISREFTVEQ